MRIRRVWMMATLPLALAALLAARPWAQSAPANISGTWQLSTPGRNGGPPLVTNYIFAAQGDHFTGLIVSSRNRSHITNGVMDGNSFTFDVPNGYQPSLPPQHWKGEITGDDMTLSYVPPANAPAGRAGGRGRGGRGPQTLHRVSDQTTYTPPPELAHAPFGPFHPIASNGLAQTPPMGWNSWNKFAGRVTDADVRAVADAMVASGMRDAGYVYVNIDDTWEGQRDANGNIQSNQKFPDMKALADYVHSKGLKLGIYSSPGPRTCAGYEGSYKHEEQDARTYAAWGIDYLKYDWCSASAVYDPEEMPSAYQKMALALRATGRPIVFSLCEYGWLNVGSWGAAAGGNLWRTTDDISDRWESMVRNGFILQEGRASVAGPGHWNDPDMLEIGNGGMTDTEYQTHLSLWAMLAAPLLAGNDIAHMTPDIRDILTNRDVIAVDQDKRGEEGTRVGGTPQDLQQTWVRRLSRGYAVALFNLGEAPATMSADWATLNIGKPHHMRNLWTHEDAAAPATFTAEVPSHGVVMLHVW